MRKYAIFEKFPKSMKKYESMPSGNPAVEQREIPKLF